jgi:DNA-binding GntR family transcriptional regulator
MDDSLSLKSKTAAAETPAPRGRGKAVDDETIYARLHSAIVVRQLEPGTKLGEEALCEVFGVSRAQIRRVLVNLAHAKLIELRPNRGAYVAQPSVREARHVFEARRTIEAAIVERAAHRITEEKIAELEAIVRDDKLAQERGDKQAAVQLSGEFHLCLARIAGNEVLLAFLSELVSRSSLIIATFGMTDEADCSVGDHRTVIEALRQGDAAGAVALVRDHLHYLEQHLRLTTAAQPSVDLKKILGEPN